jgi:hypothetical protein
VSTAEGWLYLALILELSGRMFVGWIRLTEPGDSMKN